MNYKNIEKKKKIRIILKCEKRLNIHFIIITKT